MWANKYYVGAAINQKGYLEKKYGEKVGILTFHSGLNYGASLQAYALKCVLNSKNLDTSVIDFRKEKLYGDNFWKNFFSCARLARCIYEIPYSKQIGQKKKQLKGLSAEN